MGERILVVGNGAREHALAHKLSCGAHLKPDLGRQIFVLGGNAGLARDFECLKPKSMGITDLVECAKSLAPHLVVIGPESYLADGLVDALSHQGLKVFGPTREASRLEASKAFMKKICERAH